MIDLTQIEIELGYGQDDETVLVTRGEMQELITRLRQAEKDAARYRWLRDKACHSEWHTVGSADPSAWDYIVDEYIEESGDGSNN